MIDPNAQAASEMPAVSILVVARNTGAMIDDALLSARRQSFANIEIIVVDDHSTDDTLAIAQTHAGQDPRVRLVRSSETGLTAVRNASLAAARGRWAMILDSDDLLHPAHVERLVAAAERTGADIVAANMVNFAVEDGVTHASLFAEGARWNDEQYLDLADYIAANGANGEGAMTGYLKPLFALAFLREHGLRYDPRLRIAEDYDIVARALAAGARYLFLPRPTYFYRRHARSTSHRLSVADLTAMLAASGSATRAGDVAVRDAIARRRRGLSSALAHARAIEALKAGRVVAAVRALGLDTAGWRALALSVFEGGRRRLRRGTVMHVAPPDPAVLVVGDVATGSAVAAAIAGEERAVLYRASPVDDAGRATLANGLPPITRILIAAPATLDDSGYAMHPGIARELIDE